MPLSALPPLIPIASLTLVSREEYDRLGRRADPSTASASQCVREMKDRLVQSITLHVHENGHGYGYGAIASVSIIVQWIAIIVGHVTCNTKIKLSATKCMLVVICV